MNFHSSTHHMFDQLLYYHSLISLRRRLIIYLMRPTTAKQMPCAVSRQFYYMLQIDAKYVMLVLNAFGMEFNLDCG